MTPYIVGSYGLWHEIQAVRVRGISDGSELKQHRTMCGIIEVQGYTKARPGWPTCMNCVLAFRTKDASEEIAGMIGIPVAALDPGVWRRYEP